MVEDQSFRSYFTATIIYYEKDIIARNHKKFGYILQSQ